MSTSFVRRARWLAASSLLALVAAGLGPASILATGDPPQTYGTFGPPAFGDIVRGPDGALYSSDCGNARIYRIDGAGNVTVWAGAGPGGFDNGYSGDGGHRLLAHFSCPVGLAVDRDGSILVADHLNDVVRRIDRSGLVSTIAGSGPWYTWSMGPWYPNLKHLVDGVPATQTVLDAPWDIEFDPSGNLFIADRDHDAIRMIDSAGLVTTVAGTGQRGFGGDGGPATDAKLNRVLDVAFGTSGTVYLADENNARIRRIDAAGIITTIGGTGKLGCTGDGGPATKASIQNPTSLGVLRDGTVVFTEEECHEVRAIRPDGTLVRIAGTGSVGCLGLAGGPATSATLSAPNFLQVDADGRTLLLQDYDCGLLRIDPAGRIHTIATNGAIGP